MEVDTITHTVKNIGSTKSTKDSSRDGKIYINGIKITICTIRVVNQPTKAP